MFCFEIDITSRQLAENETEGCEIYIFKTFHHVIHIATKDQVKRKTKQQKVTGYFRCSHDHTIKKNLFKKYKTVTVWQTEFRSLFRTTFLQI